MNVSAGERMLVEEIPPNTTQFSLRRFDRYTRYKFSLAAQTQVGVGETFTEESPHFTTEGKKNKKHMHSKRGFHLWSELQDQGSVILCKQKQSKQEAKAIMIN